MDLQSVSGKGWLIKSGPRLGSGVMHVIFIRFPMKNSGSEWDIGCHFNKTPGAGYSRSCPDTPTHKVAHTSFFCFFPPHKRNTDIKSMSQQRQAEMLFVLVLQMPTIGPALTASTFCLSIPGLMDLKLSTTLLFNGLPVLLWSRQQLNSS